MKHKQNLSRSGRKKYIIIVALLIILLSYVLYRGWLYLGERAINFQAYQPTVLPANVSIKGHEVSITRRPGQYHKTLSYQTNMGGNFGIGEQKSSPADYAGRMYSCSWKTENATCENLVTPKGQSYSNQVAFDMQTGKAFDQTISMLKDNVVIWITLSGDQVQKYTSANWDKLIDSLIPVSYPNEHIQHYTYNNSGA